MAAAAGGRVGAVCLLTDAEAHHGDLSDCEVPGKQSQLAAVPEAPDTACHQLHKWLLCTRVESARRRGCSRSQRSSHGVRHVTSSIASAKYVKASFERASYGAADMYEPEPRPLFSELLCGRGLWRLTVCSELRVPCAGEDLTLPDAGLTTSTTLCAISRTRGARLYPENYGGKLYKSPYSPSINHPQFTEQ